MFYGELPIKHLMVRPRLCGAVGETPAIAGDYGRALTIIVAVPCAPPPEESGGKEAQMIEQFFKKAAAIEQHRSAPVVGAYLDGVIAGLAELGYTQSTVRRYVYASEEFGRFLAEKRVDLEGVDATHVETFLRETADRRTWRGVAVDAVG